MRPKIHFIHAEMMMMINKQFKDGNFVLWIDAIKKANVFFLTVDFTEYSNGSHSYSNALKSFFLLVNFLC